MRCRAILTTDTRIKISSRTINLGGSLGEIRVNGFAKSAAMIGPNMATLLAFVVTDAAATPDILHDIAKRRRSHIQLHQRRRPHQHQRFASDFREWQRLRSLAVRFYNTKPPWLRFATSWPAPLPATSPRGLLIS